MVTTPPTYTDQVLHGIKPVTDAIGGGIHDGLKAVQDATKGGRLDLSNALPKEAADAVNGGAADIGEDGSAALAAAGVASMTGSTLMKSGFIGGLTLLAAKKNFLGFGTFLKNQQGNSTFHAIETVMAGGGMIKAALDRWAPKGWGDTFTNLSLAGLATGAAYLLFKKPMDHFVVNPLMHTMAPDGA